jgi:hypothetical protein
MLKSGRGTFILARGVFILRLGMLFFLSGTLRREG